MNEIEPMKIMDNDWELIRTLAKWDKYKEADAVTMLNAPRVEVKTAFTTQGNFTIANLFLSFVSGGVRESYLFQGVAKRLPTDVEDPFRAEDIALARALKAPGILLN